MTDLESGDKKKPILNLNFLSHGTLIVKDLGASRRLYEEFFGFEVVKPSDVSLWVRLGGDHIYVAVESPKESTPMHFLNHNGLDVSSDEEVDRCHDIVSEHAEQWGFHKITKPRVQHGTYSFYFWDFDDNAWEIQSNPKGGYTWMFERGDQEGMGHMLRDFERPQLDN
jgi:catechol 2,3-dioxygenase-like lactoylglutathione lyase family enzyme